MSVFLLNSDSNEVEVDSPTSSVVGLGGSSSGGHHHHVGGSSSLSSASQLLTQFWPKSTEEIRRIDQMEVKVQALPLARIKKIMKLDEDVKMISAEAPVLFAKAAELFIEELTLRAWIHTEDNKRRTLQRNDIAMAITKYDQFDFLIDIVPREEIKTVPSGGSGGGGGNHQQMTGGGGGPSGKGGGSSLSNLSGDNSSTSPPSTGSHLHSSSLVTGGGGTPTVLATGSGGRGSTATVNADQVHYYFHLAQQHQAALSNSQAQASSLSPSGVGSSTSNNSNNNLVVLDTNSNLRHQQTNNQIPRVVTVPNQDDKSTINSAGSGILGKTQAQVIGGNNNNSASSGGGGGIQIVQQIVTPSGDIQHIPIQLTPSQMAMIKMQLQNNSGQPIIIQTAPIQPQPQIIQVAQGSPSAFIQGGSNSGSSSSTAIISANANESD